MKRLALSTLLLVVIINGCSNTKTTSLGKKKSEFDFADPPPVLYGTISDQHGKPVFGVKVHVYTGSPSYFPLATVSTDPKGRYRVWISYGASHIDQSGHRIDISVGIALEYKNHPRTGGGLDWTGDIPNLPNYEMKKDFTIQLG